MLTRQLQRFLIVGLTTVAIDFAVYRILLFVDTPVAPAKALGFIAGTLFAFFANRLWTFDKAAGGRFVFVLFLALYLSTLTVNVGINSGVRAILETSETSSNIAFLLATGTSATLNFVGMRMVVFKSKRSSDY